MSNPWINFVKEFAAQNNISYTEALQAMKQPEIKAMYKPVKKSKTTGKGLVDGFKII